MTIHVDYAAWTPDHVRARIIEAAETLMLGEADRGPGLAGLSADVVLDANESYGYGSTAYKRFASAGAIARMEETWGWINAWLNEADRKLVYDYGFVVTRKGLTLTRMCEENDWIKRTFERRVREACQRIANNLNRKCAVRLTMEVDEVSQNQPEQAPDQVASEKSAPYYRETDCRPIKITDPETVDAEDQYIKKVGKRRRAFQQYMRKKADSRAAEAKKQAEKFAERAAAKRRKQAEREAQRVAA